MIATSFASSIREKKKAKVVSRDTFMKDSEKSARRSKAKKCKT